MCDAQRAADALLRAAARLQAQATTLTVAAQLAHDGARPALVGRARALVEQALDEAAELPGGTPEMHQDMIVGVCVEPAIMALLAAERALIPQAGEEGAA